MRNQLVKKIKNIRLLILDVDGVLTNGKIILDDQGKEIKVFNVKDGFAIVFARQMGLKTAIISARAAKAVTARAKDLKIDKVYQNALPKIKAYLRCLKELKVKSHQTCFVGDDLPDLAVLEKVGFSVAVSNAVEDVKQRVDYVTRSKGGEGAVREIVELILKEQGKWKKNLEQFL